MELAIKKEEKYESIQWGKYGFGIERTLRDYEKYAGIHFGKRAVQKEVLDRKDPVLNPTTYKTEQEWEDSFSRVFKHCIDVYKQSLDKTDYDFWCVAFERKDGSPLSRIDASESEIKSLMNTSDKFVKIWREFVTTENPDHWVVWPHSKSLGWCNKITGNL